MLCHPGLVPRHPGLDAGRWYFSEMRIRRLLALLGWRISRYRLIGELPPGPGITIGGPHTSNWDFVAFLGVAWSQQRRMRILIKRSLFKGPLGWLLTALGGIPVDRSDPGALVAELVRQAAADPDFQLVIAPKGTRQPRPYWKSGFHRISRESGLPITLAAIDRSRREVEIGPSLHASADVRADMDRIRAFYARFGGVNPQLRSEPRLREEDEPSAS